MIPPGDEVVPRRAAIPTSAPGTLHLSEGESHGIACSAADTLLGEEVSYRYA